MFDCSKLPAAAKRDGESDKLTTGAFQSGKWAGRIETLSVIALTALVVGVGAFGITKLVKSAAVKKQNACIAEIPEEAEPEEDFCDDEDDDASETAQEEDSYL